MLATKQESRKVLVKTQVRLPLVRLQELLVSLGVTFQRFADALNGIQELSAGCRYAEPASAGVTERHSLRGS